MNADMSSILNLLQMGLRWLYIVAEIGGLIICLCRLRLSSWMWLPALGFLGMAMSGLWFQVVMLVIQNQVRAGRDMEFVSMAYAAGTVVSFTSVLLVVGGLALVFHDVQKRFDDLQRFG